MKTSYRVHEKNYTVSQTKPELRNLYHNFAKIALISIKIGTHNVHMTQLNYDIVSP